MKRVVGRAASDGLLEYVDTVNQRFYKQIFPMVVGTRRGWIFFLLGTAITR